MATKSRDKILETCSALLRVQGYNGTGLNQIIKESGAPKGSLYYHFPGGKEQLAAEAIQAAAINMGGKIQAAFDQADSFAQAMEQILDNGVKDLEESNFQCGCPIATVALEAQPGPVLEACQKALQGAQHMLATRMAMEGINPEKAANIATILFSAYEGALLLSRTQRDTTPLKRLKYLLPRLLES